MVDIWEWLRNYKDVIITIIIAACGLEVLIYFFVVQRAQKSKMRVWLEMGTVTRPGVPIREEKSLIIHVANIGKGNVTLSRYWFRGPGDKDVTPLSLDSSAQSLPHELTPGQSWQTQKRVEAIARRLKRDFSGRVKVWGEVIDQAGDTHKSKPIKLDIEAESGADDA